MLAYGGLKNWNSVFGADTPFFKKKPWYVDSFNGGANSAQVFEAGGFRFLHIGFALAPSDEALKWAEGVIQRHPAVPTIVSTHSSLNHAAERKDIAAVDFNAVATVHNTPQADREHYASKTHHTLQ